MSNQKGKFHAKIMKHWLYQSKKVGDIGDGRLFVEGYASTGDVDRVGEMVVPERTIWEKAITAYMENPILLWMHQHTEPAGLVTEMRIDEGVGFWIKGFVSKTMERLQTQIQEGIVRAFSIGYDPIKTLIENGVRKVVDFELYEISIGSVPINRRTLFSISKAFMDGSDLYVPECSLQEEVDKLLTQKLAALGLGPDAKPITSSKAKGKAPESPAYSHLKTVLSEISEAERDAKLKRFKQVMNT